MAKHPHKRTLEYRTEPLKRKAAELEQSRSVSRVCREMLISRTHFYDVVNGNSASYPMLMRIAHKLGLTREEILPSDLAEKTLEKV